MADFTNGRQTRTQGVEAAQVFIGGQEAEFIFGQGTQLFPNLPVPIYGCTSYRWSSDDTGIWWEVGFTIDAPLTGNGGAGWTDAGNYLRFEIQQSLDLVSWNMGRFTPAAVPAVDNGDGTWTYWSRCSIPRLWKYVRVDVTATSSRYGKSITAVRLFGATLALPGYPYAMPAQAATLQAHLRALGYTGATVTSVAAPLSVEVVRYYYAAGAANNDVYLVTLSGTNVTLVQTSEGADIALPGYPYAMPAQAATLQAALRTAGHTGAVVRLFGDSWAASIPDRDTILGERRFEMTFTPADPRPSFTLFGVETVDQDNLVTGSSDNVRATTGGATRLEAQKQFARLKITRGTRYNHLMP